MTSCNSSSTYQSNSNNNYSNDPFSEINSKSKSYGGSLGNYETNSQNQAVIPTAPVTPIQSPPNLSVLPRINEEVDYFILLESNFTLKVKYEKEQNEVIVTYKRICFKNKDGNLEEINIGKIKKYYINNNEIKIFIERLIQFLEKVENELKAEYRKENEIEIILKMKGYGTIKSKFCLNCHFIINDGRDKNNQENDFLEEDILNPEKKSESGFHCFINAIT